MLPAFERRTLTHALQDRVSDSGDDDCCSFEGGTALSYRALAEQSNRVAAALARLGVGPGDRVALVAPNSAEFLIAAHGVHRRRAVLVPVSTELRGAFLAHQLTHSDPKLLIVHAECLGPLRDCLPDFAPPCGIVVIGGGAETARNFASLLDHPEQPEAILLPEPTDIGLILFTSGTTGRAKGVLMPHAHCFLFAWLAGRALSLTAGDRFLVTMPMFHVNALLMSLGASLIVGAHATVVRRFSASRWLAEVQRSRATVTNALGVMPEFIMAQPPGADDRGHALRRMLAVPISPQWGERFQQRFGVRLLQTYGMTECNMVAFSAPDAKLQPGCAGRIVSEHFAVDIRDPASFAPLGPGEVGEIVVRPHDPRCFMQGYFRMPAESDAAWRDGWFRTGDGGFVDAAGELHFVDRLRDCIRRRGENISSFEVEQALNAHPAVAECAVVGVKVPGAGGEDEIKAVIVPTGAPPRPEEIVDWCGPRMPRHAIPRFIEFVPAIEKTPTGKIRKEVLRSAGVSATTWDRDAAQQRAGRG